MERRRHARTPVNMNALLIGEKTVPSGCRVINVSQQGMMLYCDADGRLSTFNAGDNVDIHLTVQHAGEQKKLTIPSSVKHVADNSVDVEFHHPDAILMDLIESYRISDQYRIEASLGHNSPTAGKVTPIAGTDYGNKQRMRQDAAQATGQSASHKPFYLGLLTLVIAICIITGGYVYTASIDSRIKTLETISERQSGELSELKNRVFSASLQEGRYASLNARMTALGDAFAHLEDKLTLLIPESAAIAETDWPAEDPATAASMQQPILITADRTDAAVTTRMAMPDTPESPATTNATKTGEPDKVEPGPVADTTLADTANTSPPAGQQVDTATVEMSAPDAETSVAAGALQAEAIPSLTAATNSTTPGQANGPWTINLLSSTDENYVTGVAARARGQDIPVEVTDAEVKGRQYWRLQIPGFASYADAQESAEPVKQTLGIKDVWIFKRK